MPKAYTTVDTSSFSGDGKFRSWGSSISSLLDSAGLVQTSDTGQINWGSVNHPSVASSSAGYEIWRFNDSLQSTAPIFIRLEYGTGPATSGANPSILWYVGFSTDGAGVVSGGTGLTNSPIRAANTTGASTVSSCRVLACHREGYFFAAHENCTAGPGSSPFILSVARTHDPDTGEPDDRGCIILYGTSQSGTVVNELRQRSFNFDTSYDSSYTNHASGPIVSNTANLPGYVFPTYCHQPLPEVTPACVTFLNGDISGYSTFLCKTVGPNNRIYLSVPIIEVAGLSRGEGATNFSNSNDLRAAFLWED
jgi:hypothetical protein